MWTTFMRFWKENLSIVFVSGFLCFCSLPSLKFDLLWSFFSYVIWYNDLLFEFWHWLVQIWDHIPFPPLLFVLLLKECHWNSEKWLNFYFSLYSKLNFTLDGNPFDIICHCLLHVGASFSLYLFFDMYGIFLKRSPLDSPLASITYRQLIPLARTNCWVIKGSSPLMS